MKHLLSFLLFLSTFSFTSAQSNHSLSFDGEDDYVEIPTTGFPSGNSPTTVEAWFKRTSFSDTPEYLMSYGNYGGSLFGIGIFYDNNMLVTFDGGNFDAISNTEFSLNTWHHVAGVHLGSGNVKIYFDGVQVYSTDVNTPNVDLGNGKIGSDITGAQNWDGSLDEIRVWDLALTEDQIQANMNTSLSGDESGLVGYWNFNEGEGSTLTDLSGNGNDGTIYGATWSVDVPPRVDGNNSLNFDGVDDYVSISNNIASIYNEFTISSWVKVSNYGDPNPDFILDVGTSGEGTRMGFGINDQGFTGFIEGVNANIFNVNASSDNTSDWLNVVLSWSGTEFAKIYIDGVLVGETNDILSGTLTIQSGDAFNIGKRYSGGNYFDGYIDEVSIWDQALTGEQIQANMYSNLNGDETGLVGYWNFNDVEGSTLTDLSGNGNDGTIYGATWSGYGAPIGDQVNEQPSPNHSLSFDGVDDYVALTPIDLSSSDQMTLMCWVNATDITTDSENTIIRQDWGEPNWLLMFEQGGEKLTFHVENTSGTNLEANYQIIPSSIENSWHHVAGVYDGSNLKLYLDGLLVATQEQSGNIAFGGNNQATYLKFGSHPFPNNNDESFDGFIDEVRIWSIALTQDQIQAHMNTILSVDEEGLVGYWNFNDGEGSTLTDLSGNGNDGTIYGATWSDDGAPVQPLEELDTIATITLSDVNTYIFPGYIGDTALVAVTADLGDIDLYSSEMHFTGFQGVLGFEGIVTEGTPMGDADWNVIVNEQEEILITGNYGSDAISGDVTLFYLQFSIGDSLAEDSIAIQLAHVELNEEEGEIETFDGNVSVSHLLFGDVTQNDDVSMMDAANVLRYLVGTVEFDQYKMSAADVTMDESISALDASVVAQYAVGLVEVLPHSEGTDGQGFLTINDGLEYQPGELLEVPIMLANGNNLLSFEVDLTYNPNQVTVEGIDWSDQIDHFMIEENNEPGSIRVAGSGTTPDGQEGLFATMRLQVLETTSEESIDLTINKIRINESAPVEDVMVSITQEVLSTDNSTVPTVYALHQNYPNPFNPTTKISYDLPEASVVSLSIYDLMGREIRTMINSEQTAGFKNIQWNATDNLGKSVPAGMYIYTIQAGEFRQTRKMVLLK